LSSYINRLESIVHPLAKTVMNNLKFYKIDEYEVFATFMPPAELNELVYEYEINYTWDFDEFIEWANKVKKYLVFKVNIEPFKPM
jgi:hypothetical protein